MDVPFTLPLAEADYTLIDQVLTNLLENAARHSPDGGVIRVRARERDGWIEVAVSDQGPGVAPSDEAHIFEAFSRGEGSTSSGVGLAICRAIAEAHGGTISVQRGNRGWPSSSSRCRCIGHERVVNERILVIEDTPAIGRALRAALEARGYTVVVALTGEVGVDAAAVNDPTAIILDLGLPDAGCSADVCRRVRSWSDVPIIVLTVDDDEQHKVRTLDLGADDYVTKPFSTPELLARLRVALRRGRAVEGEPVDPVLHVGDVVVDVPHHPSVRRKG